MDADVRKLRRAVFASLRRQGYIVERGRITLPDEFEKDDVRRLHSVAAIHKLQLAEPALRRREEHLLSFIANGSEVSPTAIRPRLAYVERGTDDELLFRYASLHWSIPVSAGYGRRLRFLVIDESNGKLMGLIGLGDPVFAMRARDEWIGWDSEAKRKNLWHLMDAYVLGAVPPYSNLLCGKLVAMLALSNEVRRAFRQRYADTFSLIKRRKRPPYLAMISTTSALGRSSVYNRLRVNGNEYWRSVGFTTGSGDFHFSNGVYDALRVFAEDRCEPTAKAERWGTGFRNKREVVRKCLHALGLSLDLTYHGIEREIFLAPLGRDAVRFLKGDVSRPAFHDWSVEQLVGVFRERWLLGRAERVTDYRDFQREQYRLWPVTNES